jgi:hypothetical protein
MKHIIGLSGGKDSTAMALRLAELEPRDYEYVCTPTGEEPPEWEDHMARLEEKLGAPITRLGDDTLAGLVERWNALPNWRQRWCTRKLKIEPFYNYVFSNLPVTCYVGLRYDESFREGFSTGEIEGFHQRFPLQEWGWGLAEVLNYLREGHGIVIDFRTDCMNCFFQTLWEWWCLWFDDYPAYCRYKGMEERTGYTFRSPGRDTWPASLAELEVEFDKGRIPREVTKRAKSCAWCQA